METNANNERKRKSKENETDEEKRARLDKKNEQARLKRQSETEEQRTIRLGKEKEQRRLRKEKETSDQRSVRLEQDRAAHREYLKNETLEQRKKRLELDRNRHRSAIENESSEQRQERMELDRNRHRSAIENEPPEHRQKRLDSKRNCQRTSVENETADEKRERLDRNNYLRSQVPVEQRAGTRRQLSKSASFRDIAKNAGDDENLIQEDYLGKMDIVCEECGSLNFPSERTGNKPEDKFKFTRCCEKGQVKLEPLHTYPTVMKSLLTKQHNLSKNFMECIRAYNSSFAFASTGVTIKPPPGFGPYCFRVSGQIVHYTGTLHPAAGDQRKFAQIYILDPDDAAIQRMTLPENQRCKKSLMEEIGKVINRETNEYAAAFKMMYEVEEDAFKEAQLKGIPMPNIKIAITSDSSKDKRRYNLPTSNEVAIVFQSDDGEPPYERDIIVHSRPNNNNTNLQSIDITNENLDPMTYPVFFPTGQKGWKVDIKRQIKQKVKKSNDSENEEDEQQDNVKHRTRVSMKEYFSYRLSQRNEFNPILNGGKLFQQYVVDAYVRAEAHDLRWVHMNQGILKAEKYKGLVDHVNEGNDHSVNIGKTIILPSSFQGSPRNMQQNFQDAMAIVTKFGKPDLFVTMTCNPKWKEITENLEPWQSPEMRPDMVSRVFNLKLKNLLSDICDKDKFLFGKVIAKIHVIEFQKRGLPHAHILIILDSHNKFQTEQDIDNVVKAEIPDPIKSPRLYDIVTRNMIHTPCGERNMNSPCMLDGKACAKGFPKPFQNDTMGCVDGYPKYKRRKTASVKIGKNDIDNSWVVPYNPYLLLRYNCHINVEVCASVKSVKYLFKYVYKGHDCANVTVEDQNRNEPKEFVDSRYVSAPEGIWRIFGMKMHHQTHTIYRLPVHLKDEQTICFKPGSIQAAIERAAIKETKLTDYFKLNTRDENAREYKYIDIPTYYKWEKNTWIKRKAQHSGDKVIGRMYTVSIKDQERYYLRLLLCNTTDVRSFLHLRSCPSDDGSTTLIFKTFKEAAKVRRLLLDDSVWQETLDDARVFAMPYQMRQVFAYICAYGQPSDTKLLWENNKQDMMEDFCHKIHSREETCTETCEAYALRDLKETFCLLSIDWEKLGMPYVQANLPPLENIVFNAQELIQRANEMIESMNIQQRNAFETIVNATNSRAASPKCLFLDGPGGSGKTYLYITLINYFKGRNEIILPAASTGIAANLLPGGRTYHSLCKLPIPTLENSVSNMKPNSFDANIIRKSKLLIIDECTMASCYAMNTIDRLYKDIMNNNLPYGGKVILLGGDFRQCLSIVPHAMRPAIIERTLKKSKSWKHFQKLSLVSNMRSVDPAYSEWLLKLGNGQLHNDDGLPDDLIEIPSQYLCTGNIINEIFFGDDIHEGMIESIFKRAILCPKNVDVDRINDDIISRLQGESCTYLSDDVIVTDDEEERNNFSVDFLNSINVSGMPTHSLTLKKGTIVMLLRNLNTKKGLCNGTRLIIRDMKPNIIMADKLTENGVGESVLIPRIDLINSTDMPFTFRRRQFPIKPAFAMTINKSQGQTLERVGIYLSEPVFAHGQLYVAFSRVKRSADVKIQIVDGPEQGKLIEGSDKVFTRNVVYTEVLQWDDETTKENDVFNDEYDELFLEMRIDEEMNEIPRVLGNAFNDEDDKMLGEVRDEFENDL